MFEAVVKSISLSASGFIVNANIIHDQLARSM